MDCKDSGEDRGGKKGDSYDRSASPDWDTARPIFTRTWFFNQTHFHSDPLLTGPCFFTLPHFNSALPLHSAPFLLGPIFTMPCLYSCSPMLTWPCFFTRPSLFTLPCHMVDKCHCHGINLIAFCKFSIQLGKVFLTTPSKMGFLIWNWQNCSIPPPDRCVAVRRIRGRIIREGEEKGRKRVEEEEEVGEEEGGAFWRWAIFSGVLGKVCKENRVGGKGEVLLVTFSLPSSVLHHFWKPFGMSS